MAARAYWKGQIRLALVSIPVEIYPATKSGAAISFRQIHEPSGKPVKYEKIVPGIGAIDTDDIVKGYETSKGNYVLLDEEKIEAVELESKRTLELLQFVDASVIEDVEEPGPVQSGSNVIDLMAALKASVDGKKKPPAKAASTKKAPVKKAAERNEPDAHVVCFRTFPVPLRRQGPIVRPRPFERREQESRDGR